MTLDNRPEIEDPLSSIEEATAKASSTIWEKLPARLAKKENAEKPKQPEVIESAEDLRTQMEAELTKLNAITDPNADRVGYQTTVWKLTELQEKLGRAGGDAEAIGQMQQRISTAFGRFGAAKRAEPLPAPTPEPERPEVTPEPTPTPPTPEAVRPVPTPEPTPEPVRPITTEPTPTPEAVRTPEPTSTPSTPEAVRPVARLETLVPRTPEPITPRTPEELQRLEERVNETRQEYLKAKKEKQESGNVRNWFSQRKRTSTIDKALEDAETAYRQARAEYVGAESAKFMAEMGKLEDEELKYLFKDSKENVLVKKYKEWGETSFFGVDVKHGSRLKRFAFNKRTVISAALLTASIASGPAGWAGAGAVFAARRVFGGLGAGVAVNELAKNARRAHVMKDLSERPSYTIEEYNEVIMTMKARAALDGTTEQLAASPEYQQAIEARNKKIEREFQGMSPEDKARNVETYFSSHHAQLDQQILAEKKWNNRAKLMGVTAGVFVGSGAAAELIKGLGGKSITAIKEWWGGPSVATPGVANASAEAAHSTMSVESDMRGHIVEAAPNAQETVLAVGNRGIEGTLLDLKDSNPKLYQTMIENLKGQDPNFKGNDGGLIHRFAERFAEEKGLNIDEGGGNDLSKIFSGEVTIDPTDGEIGIKHELMPDNAPSVENAADVAPEADSETPIEEQGMETDSPTESHASTPEPLKVNSVNLQGTLKYTPTGEMSPAPEIVSTEDSVASDSTETNPATESAREAKLIEALNMEKNSDMLKAIMSRGEYSQFLKDYALSESNLNSIPQEMNVGEFMEKLSDDDEFAKKFSGFAKKLTSVTKEAGSRLVNTDSIREIMVILADNKIK